MSTMKPTTSADPDDMVDVDRLVDPLFNIETGARHGLRLINRSEVVDLSEGSPLWNMVSELAGELANLAETAWPEGTGPIS